MANTTITYYKTDPVYTNEKFLTNAVGKKGFFTTDVKKTIGLTGKEVDNNFLTLEGRDIYNFYFDERKNLTIETLNGDKYTVSLLGEIKQPDWSEKDVKSVSYIRNKPENLSDFNNDFGYTKTTFQSSVYPEDRKDVYEIGIIAVNNKPIKLYGKVFRWPEIETVDVEYDDRINNYVFNISNDKFERNKTKNYLLYPFYDDKGETVDILVTFNHDVFLYSDNSEIQKTQVKWMDILLDGYTDSDVYYLITSSKPIRFSCTTDEEGQRYVYMMPMDVVQQDKQPEKFLVSITNDNGDGVVVTATDIPSAIATEVYIYDAETTTILYASKEVVKLNSTDSVDYKPLNCNWAVSDMSGNETTYEDVSTISFTPTDNTSVRSYPVKS